MKKFTVTSSEKIVDEPFCHIEKQTVVFPDKTTGDWFVHHSNDAVIVIPQAKDGQILLQKNYKHGSAHIVTEVCAGIIDEGETPEKAAQRELQEETGFTAESFVFLGTTFANPTSSPMKYHFFLGKNITKTDTQSLESAEQIEPFWAKSIESAKAILSDKNTQTSSATMAAFGFL